MNNVEDLIYNDSLFIQAKNLASQFKYRENDFLPDVYWKDLSDIKKRAVSSSDQLVSKVAWCFETIGSIQDQFVKVYTQLNNKDYYNAWCTLERCEINIGFLDKHFHDRNNEFGIEHIRSYVNKLQSLFPYRTFLSPSFTAKKHCSVCNTVITPRHNCEHESGEIYDGELCTRIIHPEHLLEVSIVQNPVQKYSVVNPENHSYELLEYLTKKPLSPWESWDYNISKRTIPKYSKIGRNDLCPCGSNLKYKKCCLKEKKEIDHYTFILNEN